VPSKVLLIFKIQAIFVSLLAEIRRVEKSKRKKKLLCLMPPSATKEKMQISLGDNLAY